MKRLAIVLAWLLLAVIFLSTVSPLVDRPRTGFSADFERFGAFGLTGLAFALAYPRRLLFVAAVMLGSAIGFELLQMITADRHARLSDMAVKLAGAVAGILVGWSARRISGRLRRGGEKPG